MRRTRFLMMAVVAMVASALVAVPASAQTQQDGLVNVNLQDVDIGVPIAVAANICPDVNINVLARSIGADTIACDADADAGAVFGPQTGGGNTRQEGLVNVNVEDVVVKVPVAVAANVCPDVDANVIAEQISADTIVCTADADSSA